MNAIWWISAPLYDGDGNRCGWECSHLHADPRSHRNEWIRIRPTADGGYWEIRLCEECYRLVRLVRHRRRAARRERRRSRAGAVFSS